MKTLISCAYNMDNCCVEVKFSDGSMIAIDTIKPPWRSWAVSSISSLL